MSKLFVDEIVHQSSQGSGTITIGASGETINVVGTLQNNGSAVGGVNTPAFLAASTSNQTIANETNTLIQYNAELFDTDNCYDNTAGNYSFTPNVAGKYYVFASVRMDTASDFDYLAIEISKNNTSPPIILSNMRSEFYEHLKCCIHLLKYQSVELFFC